MLEWLTCIVLAAMTSPGQAVPPPVVSPQTTTEPKPIPPIEQYLYFDADAAVEEVAKWVPGVLRQYESSVQSRPSLSALNQLSTVRVQTASALLYTEGSMRNAAFGRYAMSAPLTPAPPTIGLSGRYEVLSRSAGLMITEIVANRAVHEDNTVIDVARQWYIVTVSYCLRWKLDCADALVAAAERDFPDDAEMLLLIGSVAETRGRWAAAATSLQRALAANPQLVEARLRLGRVDWQRGRATSSDVLLTALADARASGNVVVEYFTLRALEDVNTRAGRTDRARARRAEANALRPFQNQPDLATLDAWALYRSGQFYQVPERLAALRRQVRAWAGGTDASWLPTSDFRLPTSYFLLPTSYLPVPSAWCLLPMPSAQCLMPSAFLS